MKELDDAFAVKKMKTYKDAWRGNDASSNALQAQKDEAMLQILTPDEKFEYDLRRSDAARRVAGWIKGFRTERGQNFGLFSRP